MKSLTEQAKEMEIKSVYKHSKNVSIDDIELVIAWLRDDVQQITIRKLKNKLGVSVYSYLAITLKEAYKRGIIEIK